MILHSFEGTFENNNDPKELTKLNTKHSWRFTNKNIVTCPYCCLIIKDLKNVKLADNIKKE